MYYLYLNFILVRYDLHCVRLIASPTQYYYDFSKYKLHQTFAHTSLTAINIWILRWLAGGPGHLYLRLHVPDDHSQPAVMGITQCRMFQYPRKL